MKKIQALLVMLACLILLASCGEQSPSLSLPTASSTSPSISPSSTAKPVGPCADGHSFTDDSDVCARCGANYYAETLEFTLTDTRNAYALSGPGSCERTVIKVPDTYNGRPVTAVASFAFFGKEKGEQAQRITEVVLPDTITTIGKYAFRQCRALEKINLPQSLTEIQEYAFAECEALKSVEIPEKVTVLERGIFANCRSLETVTMTWRVSVIGIEAFAGCVNLPEIAIPETVTSIGDRAFGNCEKIAEFHLPEGLQALGKEAFGGCVSLETICIPAGIVSVDELFAGCTSLKTVTFAGPVEEIGNGTFRNCTSLTEIVLPDTVTSIGHRAFIRCTSLRSVVLPKDVETWGMDIFKDCSALEYTIYENGKYLPNADSEYAYFMDMVDPTQKELTLHEDTVGCGYQAFEGSQLQTLRIGKSLQSIVRSNFKNLSMLETIEVSGENQYLHVTGGCLIETATKTLIRACKGAVIPDDGSVTHINIEAFAYLIGIRSVVIPDSVTSLDAGVFVYCTDLEELIIGKGMQDIDHDQLLGCEKFTRIYYHGTQSQWEQIKIFGITSGGGLFGANDEIENATIYFYSETEPTQPGNYWHYVDGVPTPWKTEET